MGTEIVAKDVLRSAQMIAAEGRVVLGLDDDTKAIAAGKLGSKRISIKGGVFRKFAGGKEVAKIEDRHLDVIFVKAAHKPSSKYFAKPYEEGSKENPECWSTDSVAPDPEVKNPKARKCNECQFSVKGSSRDGKGRACTLEWHTAVVLPGDPKGDIMKLVIPSASIWGDEKNGKWPFQSYAIYLANNNVSLGHVVTRVRFDTDVQYPKLLFSPASATPIEVLGDIHEQSTSAEAQNAVKFSIYQGKEEESVAPAAIESTPSPVVRDGNHDKGAVPENKDLSSVVAQWSNKKK
jgi:hypothetical protein